MSKNKITGMWHGKRYDYKDREKSTFNLLVKKLRYLRENYGVVGVKQSFEDEGALLADVMTMRRITELCGIKLYIKIGGCEAITDINNCVNMGVDAIIPPMIETPYAFSKFNDSVKNIEDTEFYFLCETKVAYSNLDKILKTSENLLISGIIVGRSDFTKSHGKTKKDVDSKFISKKVEKIFSKAKKLDLTTTLGGSISISSAPFIKSLFKRQLLDKIETRNIVVELNKKNVENLEETIEQIISYEIDWLNYKSENYGSIGESYLQRSKTLASRIKK